MDAVRTHDALDIRTSHKVDGSRTDNTAPTAADKTVTAIAGTAYAFTTDDFGFADDDPDDMLASVTIESLPAAGTLALGGTVVTLNQAATRTRLDAGDLTFTPASGAGGAGYASFTFKVNDGTVDSTGAYTMTIDVTDAPAPVCTAPDIAGDGRREIWTGTVTVGPFPGPVTDYGFDSDSSIGSLLPSSTFAIGSNSYTITSVVYVLTEETTRGILALSFGGAELTATEKAALRLHVCDEVFGFSTADTSHRVVYGWPDTGLDWSPPVETRTLYLSLPANHAATGAPAIIGTAWVGATLSADTSPIMDGDGLTGVDFTYKWFRVGRGRRLQRRGDFGRDRRDLRAHRRRHGQAGEGAGELHRQPGRRGDAHRRGVSGGRDGTASPHSRSCADRHQRGRNLVGDRDGAAGRGRAMRRIQHVRWLLRPLYRNRHQTRRRRKRRAADV